MLMDPEKEQPTPSDPVLSQPLDLPADTTEQEADTSSSGHSALREALSTIAVLASALIVALCLIAFVFQSYQVSGPSMEDTLHDQDRLIVWKLPRSWARVTGHAYVPNRGDVIIFNESGLSQFGQENTKQLIKRVIGLPGDRVVVANNTITIFNKEHPKGFEPDKTLPYGTGITKPAEQTVEYTVGKDQVFVSGDNRTNSLDSRFFGPINSDQIVGKLVIRVLPLSDAKRF